MNPKREVIAGPGVPKTIGPYSAGVRAGDFLYVSGQAGTDPATGEPAGATIGEQARQAMRNVEAVQGRRQPPGARGERRARRVAVAA